MALLRDRLGDISRPARLRGPRAVVPAQHPVGELPD